MAFDTPIEQDKAGDSSRSQTPRKRPCCKKCGKPMLGHKRRQCDVEHTPTKVKEEDVSGELAVGLAHLRIVGAECNGTEGEELKVNAGPSTDKSLTEKPRLVKQETVASLTSNDKAMLETLGTPGIMARDNAVDESVARAGVEQWLESIPRPASPGCSTRKRLSGPPIRPNRDFDAMLDLPLPPQGGEPGTRRPIARVAKPIGRISNAADRKLFFGELARKSKKPVAGVFTVDMRDVRALEEDAKHLNLHARVIAPKYADGSTGNGLLVVGRDEDSVREVFSEIEKDVKSGNGARTGCMSVLGSLVTGAVVAWTLLAFS